MLSGRIIGMAVGRGREVIPVGEKAKGGREVGRGGMMMKKASTTMTIMIGGMKEIGKGTRTGIEGGQGGRRIENGVINIGIGQPRGGAGGKTPTDELGEGQRVAVPVGGTGPYIETILNAGGDIVHPGNRRARILFIQATGGKEGGRTVDDNHLPILRATVLLYGIETTVSIVRASARGLVNELGRQSRNRVSRLRNTMDILAMLLLLPLATASINQRKIASSAKTNYERG